MPILRQETFWPVAAVVRVADEEEASATANHAVFGLGANLWTRDVERGKRETRRLEAGGVFINGVPASHPRLPCGGVKRSGRHGRELSRFGVRELVDVQTIWI